MHRHWSKTRRSTINYSLVLLLILLLILLLPLLLSLPLVLTAPIFTPTTPTTPTFTSISTSPISTAAPSLLHYFFFFYYFYSPSYWYSYSCCYSCSSDRHTPSDFPQLPPPIPSESLALATQACTTIHPFACVSTSSARHIRSHSLSPHKQPSCTAQHPSSYALTLQDVSGPADHSL
jgi:hypothetical protein